MKRHVVVSGIAFGITALTLGSLLVGCSNTNVEETPGVTPEELQASLSTAIKAAEDNLVSARTELEALIAAGDDTTAQQLTDAVNKLNAAIENAKKAATDSNAATKSELLTSIETAKLFAIDAAGTTLLAAKEELSAAIVAGDLANVDAMTVAVSNLQAAINAASETAANADTELSNKLMAALEDVKAEVAEAVKLQLDAAAANLQATVNESNATNAAAIAEAVGQLNAARELAQQFATTADMALKAEIQEQINTVYANAQNDIKTSVELAYAELDAKIKSGDAASATALANAVETLNFAISNAMKATIEEVNATIAATKTDLEELFTEALNAKSNEFQALLNASNLDNAQALKASSDELKGLIDAAVLTGSNELSVAVTELETKMMDAVDAKLASLKADMEAALAGEVADINATLEAFNLSVDAAKTLFGDADAALKAELVALIDSTKSDILATGALALEAAKVEVVGLINAGDQASADALAAAKVELEGKIELVNELYNAMNAAGATDAELAEVNAALTEAINAVKAASIQISDWTDATDELVKENGGLDKLYALYAKYENKINTYNGDDFEKVKALYHDAWVRMVRVSNIADIDVILTDFDETASLVRTIPDVIYDAILEVAPSVDEVSYPEDKPGLDYVGSLIQAALDSGNVYVMDNLRAYGDEGEDLLARYDAYVEQYNTLLRKSDGTIIKEKMDELVAIPLVYSDADTVATMFALRSDFDVWFAHEKNELANVEGFAETYENFLAYEARYAALSAASAEAERLNADVLDLIAKIEETGATIMNKEALDAINLRVELWKTVYFSAPYADDVTSANYEMLDHAKVDELQVVFAEKVEAFKVAAQKFADKVDAIGDVNLMKWDEINEALTEYGILVISRDLNDFNYLFNETSTPAEYYDRLITIYTEYRNLKAEALDAFMATHNPLVGNVVDIYDGAILEAALGWYAQYGVKDESGAIVFDNGKYGTGYVLSNSVVVDTDTYEMVLGMKADYDALVEAKVAETADVMTKIDEIGTVTVLGAERVFVAMRAYNAWLDGSNTPDGFLAVQFAANTADETYVVENYDVLVAALDKLAMLKEQVNVISNAINNELAAKNSYSDFVDAAERDTYQAQLDAIYVLMDQFLVDNSGETGVIAEALMDKLVAGQNAVYKFDAMIELVTAAADVCTALDMLNVSAMDLDYMVGKVAYVKNVALANLDASNVAEEIAAERDLGLAKIAAILETANCYEKYVMALAADVSIDDDAKTVLANELAVSYEVTVNRMADTTVYDDVAQNIKFVESELESIYPMNVAPVEP